MKDEACSQSEFDAYLYIITHDLKTFSRAMRVIPEWIEEDMSEAEVALPDNVQDHIAMLQRYARGLDMMLDGLTDLSRVGRLADRAAPQALHAAIMTAWEEVPGRDGFSLDLDGVHGAVLAPANDLGRLLHTLLSNAVSHHHAPPGRITVSNLNSGGRLVLRISDDGPGIEEEFREKVFEPLYTLRPKDDGASAGMGLAVARKVVQTLGGQIAVIPPPGGYGTTVECDFPPCSPEDLAALSATGR